MNTFNQVKPIKSVSSLDSGNFGSKRPMTDFSFFQSFNPYQIGNDIGNILAPHSAKEFLGSLTNIATTIAKMFI